MTKQYQLPTPIGIAVSTERLQFLQKTEPATFEGEQVKQLLADLIEDRVKLRQELTKIRDSASDVVGQASSLLRKANNLLCILNGEEPVDLQEGGAKCL